MSYQLDPQPGGTAVVAMVVITIAFSVGFVCGGVGFWLVSKIL